MSDRNILKDARKFALYDWCKTHKTELAEMQRAKVAKMAETALGFAVTESNITGMCRSLKIERKYKSSGRRLNTRYVAEMLLKVADMLRTTLWQADPQIREVCDELRDALKMPNGDPAKPEAGT